jgi:hypothetical protein
MGIAKMYIFFNFELSLLNNAPLSVRESTGSN